MPELSSETVASKDDSATLGQIVAAVAVGYAIYVFAGVGAAMVVSEYGHLGLLLLWVIGFGAGQAALIVLKDSRSPIVGWLLGVGVFLVAYYVFLHYFRHNMVDGEKGWLESARLLPLFFKQNQVSAFIGLIGAVSGAMSAYRQTARKYRYVRVEA